MLSQSLKIQRAVFFFGFNTSSDMIFSACLLWMTESTEVYLAWLTNHVSIPVAFDAIGLEVTLWQATLYYHWLIRRPFPSLLDMIVGCCKIDSTYGTTSFWCCHARNFALSWHWINMKIFRVIIWIDIEVVGPITSIHDQISSQLRRVHCSQCGFHGTQAQTNSGAQGNFSKMVPTDYLRTINYSNVKINGYFS